MIWGDEGKDSHKKICIIYYHLDENGEKFFHTDGGKHIVEPISLIYDRNEYYLTCYDKNGNINIIFRLDRIDSVEILEDVICDETKNRRRGITRYNASIFKMCGGETVKVTLEFNRKVIEGVYDEFGTKTKIKPCGECFTARVDVQISPTFWGGCSSLRGR